jgi:curved DNA-binding protein CbpA
VRVEPEAPDGPWATLYLVPGAPTEVIKAVYRALSQKYHPDRGGDVARMQEINAAMAALIK